MGAVTRIWRVIVDVAIFTVVLLYLPGVPPYGEFESYTFPPVPLFQDALSPKDFALNRVEKLFENKVIGPEALEVSPLEPGVFYTTLQGGIVAKVYDNGNKMEPIAKFGEKCEGIWDAHKCGRPLGIRFDKNGDLIVADAYYGLFKINVKAGVSTNLVPKNFYIEGKTTKLFNSVAPASDGQIYYTVSSTNYYLEEAVGELLGSPSGRLLVYNPSKNESTVLKEGIHFANGIVLSPEEDYIILAECLQFRLLKYWIKGPKKGTSEIFMEGLPGTPDNLSFSPDGNIFVSLVTVRLSERFDAMGFVYQHPLLRKLILRLLHIVKFPLDLISTYLGLPFATKLSFHVLNFDTLKPFIAPYAMILEVDWNGRIVTSWHSNSPDHLHYSEAKIIDGYMYLASPYNPYLGRLKLDT